MPTAISKNGRNLEHLRKNADKLAREKAGFLTKNKNYCTTFPGTKHFGGSSLSSRIPHMFVTRPVPAAGRRLTDSFPPPLRRCSFESALALTLTTRLVSKYPSSGFSKTTQQTRQTRTARLFS